MKITSLQNPTIKNILKLQQKSSARKEQKAFVVEGIQENEYALKNGFTLLAFYVEPKIYNDQIDLPNDESIVELDSKVYEKIAYRSGSEGIIGVYEYQEKKIDWENSKLILVLEGIEKPGNLGAILRSSLAFAVDGIILSNSNLDVFNPNVIRSSVGTVFEMPIQSLSNEDSLNNLKQFNFEIYSTDMHEKAESLGEFQFAEKTALVFGEEHSGLTDFWKLNSNINFLIPMNNEIDSLNLSNAVAISLYTFRQQKKPTAKR